MLQGDGKPVQQRSASWGSLAQAAGGQGSRPPAVPRYTFTAAATPADAQLASADFPATLPQLTARQPQWSPPSHSVAQRQRQPEVAAEALAAELLLRHAWAGPELVATVLDAAGGDAAAAAVLLDDMLAPGSSSSAPQRAQQAARAAAAAQHGGSSQQTAAAGSGSPLQAGEDDEQWTKEELADPYHRHRAAALQLSRRWGRAARAAAAAYAAEQHSEARALAAQAQRLRAEALAAHAAAAERIEADNNADKG